MAGIKELLQRFEAAEKGRTGPAAAWVPPGVAGGAEKSGGPVVQAAVALPSPAVTGSGAAEGTEKSAEAAGRQDITRLADAAKCEVYVCYEGPLGSHLRCFVCKNVLSKTITAFVLLMLVSIFFQNSTTPGQDQTRWKKSALSELHLGQLAVLSG